MQNIAEPEVTLLVTARLLVEGSRCPTKAARLQNKSMM
jgi:hypothetical protein